MKKYIMDKWINNPDVPTIGELVWAIIQIAFVIVIMSIFSVGLENVSQNGF